MSKLGNGHQAGETTILATMAGLMVPMQDFINFARPRHLLTKFHRTFSRDQHASMPLEEERDACDPGIYSVFVADEPLESPRSRYLDGVTELFRCRSLNAVASLMSTGSRTGEARIGFESRVLKRMV
ncbi:hypothetical protein F5Y13DRAFT_6602 [Hypoxylon sp. FL1857]|nr:hypothetical protein F5Y13DRAFT_6602 [Hypoxylon sp. FL1857]